MLLLLLEIDNLESMDEDEDCNGFDGEAFVFAFGFSFVSARRGLLVLRSFGIPPANKPPSELATFPSH